MQNWLDKLDDFANRLLPPEKEKDGEEHGNHESNREEEEEEEYDADRMITIDPLLEMEYASPITMIHDEDGVETSSGNDDENEDARDLVEEQNDDVHNDDEVGEHDKGQMPKIHIHEIIQNKVKSNDSNNVPVQQVDTVPNTSEVDTLQHHTRGILDRVVADNTPQKIFPETTMLLQSSTDQYQHELPREEASFQQSKQNSMTDTSDNQEAQLTVPSSIDITMDVDEDDDIDDSELSWMNPPPVVNVPFETHMNCLGVVHLRILEAQDLPCPIGSNVQYAVSLLPWKGKVRSDVAVAFDGSYSGRRRHRQRRGVCVKWNTHRHDDLLQNHNVNTNNLTADNVDGCSMVHAWNSEDTPIPTIQVDILFQPIKKVLEFSMCTLQLSCEPLMRQSGIWRKRWCQAAIAPHMRDQGERHPVVLLEAVFFPALNDDDEITDLKSFKAGEEGASFYGNDDDDNDNNDEVSASTTAAASRATFKSVLHAKHKPHLLKKHTFWTPGTCCICNRPLMIGWNGGHRCEACHIDCCSDCRLQIDLQIPCGSAEAKRAVESSIQSKLSVNNVMSTIAPVDKEYEKKRRRHRRRFVNDAKEGMRSKGYVGSDGANASPIGQRSGNLEQGADNCDSDCSGSEATPSMVHADGIGTLEVKVHKAHIFAKPLPMETNAQTVFESTSTPAGRSSFLRTGDYYVRITSLGERGQQSVRTQTIQNSGRPRFESSNLFLNVDHYGMEYRLDVVDASAEKSIGTTILTTQMLLHLQKNSQIKEEGIRSFVPSFHLRPRDQQPLKMKLELRTGFQKPNVEFFVTSKQAKNPKDTKPGSISGWVSIDVLLKEKVHQLYGPNPSECPPRPPLPLDMEMFQVYVGRITDMLADLKSLFDAYQYMISWENPLLTALSLVSFFWFTLRFNIEYIGSLPFFFISISMFYLGITRLSGRMKDRFIDREKRSLMGVEREATLDYWIHRPVGRIQLEVVKGKNLRSRELGLPGNVGCKVFWDPLRFCKDEENKEMLTKADKITKANHEIGDTNYIYNINPTWDFCRESHEVTRLRRLVPVQGTTFWGASTSQGAPKLVFPLLQPIRENERSEAATENTARYRPHTVPWSQSKGAIVIQVRFRDALNCLASFEDVLGEVTIPVSKLVENVEIKGWFHVLEVGTTNVMRGNESEVEAPQIYLRLRWERPENPTEESDTSRETSIIVAEELIRSAAMASGNKVNIIGSSLGALNTVRGLGGNVQSIQNVLGSCVDMLEILRGLFSFTHPEKSTIVLLFFALMWMLLSLIPTRVLVLLGGIGQYMASAASKLARKTERRAPRRRDGNARDKNTSHRNPFGVWLTNAFRSIPTDEDLRKVYYWEGRRIAEQENMKSATKRRLTRLERRWKAVWHSTIHMKVLNQTNSSPTREEWYWEKVFSVVHGRRFLFWSSEAVFDSGDPPQKWIFLSGHAGLASLSPIDTMQLKKDEVPLVVTIFGRGLNGQQRLTLLLPDKETKDALEEIVMAASLKKD